MSGSQQKFSTHDCYPMDGQSASGQKTRFHMRYLTGRSPSGAYDQSVWGLYNLATPHHEEWWTPNPACGLAFHSVDDNDRDPPGGFIRAREEVLKKWVDEGPHTLLDVEWWANFETFKQSTNAGAIDIWGNPDCWEASNDDGRVFFIGLAHEGGDGGGLIRYGGGGGRGAGSVLG